MATVQVPTKSGNPYHESEDGQFTSANGSSSSSKLKNFEPKFSFEEFKEEALREADLLDSFEDLDYETKDAISKELESSYKELEEQWKEDYIKEFGDKEENEYVTYDSLGDFVENAPTKLFTDNVLNKIFDFKIDSNSISLSSGAFQTVFSHHRELNPLAVLLMNTRFPRPYMKHCTEKEFNEKVGFLDRHPLDGDRDLDEIEDRIFSGKHEWICLYRKIGTGEDNKDEIHANHYSKQEDYDKTILGGRDNWYGSAIYMSASRFYSEEWGSSYNSILLGAMVNLKDLKIVKAQSTKYGSADRIHQEFRSNYVVQAKLKAKLKDRIYSMTKDLNKAENYSDAIVRTLIFDQGCFYTALGYDALYGHTGQLDILNPNKCYLQG